MMSKLSDMLRGIALGEGMSEPVDGCEASKRRVLIEAADKLESQGVGLITLHADLYYLKRELERAESERDAALADIPHECGTCKYNSITFNGCTQDYSCALEQCKWEWRGKDGKVKWIG